MLPFGLTPTEVAAPALVVALVAIRYYYGSVLLSMRFLPFWSRARAVFMPTIVDTLAKRIAGISAENHATREEWVDDLRTDRSPVAVARALARDSAKRFEVSVLSGYKSDWNGNPEAASIVTYHGPKPFAAAPDWLRPYQTHIFLFRTQGDAVRVCAHREANSWRPDLWRDHLGKGASFSAEQGVERVREWLRNVDV